MTPNEAYDWLCARFVRIATVNEAYAMLSWDAAVIMPPGGGPARADQLAVLAGVAHALLAAPEVAEALAFAREEPDEPWQAANLALMRRAHARAVAVPGDLIEAQAHANSTCEKIWREARVKSDFAIVAASLAEVVRLVRAQAQALGQALGLDPYDALMDSFQRGVTAAEVEPVFASHRRFLAEALPQAEARQRHAAPMELPRGPFPLERQEALCCRLAERGGLDFTWARLDRSAHPFCGGTVSDVRVTNRYDEADVTQAVMAILHETGHALYERGRPAGFARLPVGEAAGIAVHESQSLIVEMQACRSDGFLAFLAGELNTAFGADEFSPAALTQFYRRVKRGFIRVEADELTYPAHVLLRFELERTLIRGELEVADLPMAWNEGFFALMGTMPPDDASGCLQDIHWYDGAFGYFPSYTLGAMAAAQLMATARQMIPGLDAALEGGDLGPLIGWLRVKVHSVGSLLGFNDLMRVVTGRGLDAADFIAHLQARYLR